MRWNICWKIEVIHKMFVWVDAVMVGIIKAPTRADMTQIVK
jgi:hypothetical protein